MKHFLSLIFLFISVYVYSQTRVDSIRSRLLDLDDHSVIVVAHRGDWRNAPENSIAAIERAADMGVDVVEIDVRKTKDGYLILMHDDTLNRTTTGKGKVSNWTLDSLKTLRLKNGAAYRTMHRIPTLEEALLASKGKVMLNLDKASGYFEEIFMLLEKTGTTHQIILKGTKTVEEVKHQFGKYLPDVIYMPIINLDRDDALSDVQKCLAGLNPVAIEFLYRSDENPLPKKIKEMLSGKSKIWYNTLSDTMAGGHDDDASTISVEKGFGYLIDELGCRIIQTDRPQLLLQYLQDKK